MKKFPKIVFIQRGEEDCLLAYEKNDEAEDGHIAIYELKEVKTKRTETIIE